MRLSLMMLVAVSVAGCASNGVRSQASSTAQMDAEVYAAALEKIFPEAKERPGRQFVIIQDAQKKGQEGLLPELWDEVYRIPGVDSFLVANWVDVATGRRDLLPLGSKMQKHLGVRVTIVTSAKLRQLPNPVSTVVDTAFSGESPGWRKLYQAYPGFYMYITFTTIGYSTDYTKAIVEVRYGCSDDCGGGTVVFLKRVKGKWVAVEAKGMWEV